MTPRARFLMILAALSFAYYYSLTRIMGYVAAIALPQHWLDVPPAEQPFRMFLIELTTAVPVHLIVGAVFGYLVTKLFPSRHLLCGFAVVAMSWLIMVAEMFPASWSSIVRMTVPQSWWLSPPFFAWLSSVPLYAALFSYIGRSSGRSPAAGIASDQARSEADSPPSTVT